MRGVKAFVGCGQVSSHFSKRSRPFHRFPIQQPKQLNSQQYTLIPSSMASTDVREVEWPAKKVRETFIKYFEDKHDHTFGEDSLLTFSYVLLWC